MPKRKQPIMPIHIQDRPGENRFWSILPFPNEDESKIRVNQLVDTTTNPPVYKEPRIEISLFWITTDEQMRAFNLALRKADAQMVYWRKWTGERVDDHATSL